MWEHVFQHAWSNSEVFCVRVRVSQRMEMRTPVEKERRRRRRKKPVCFSTSSTMHCVKQARNFNVHEEELGKEERKKRKKKKKRTILVHVCSAEFCKVIVN